MKKILSIILTWIISIYFFSTIIFVPYFNWQYAKENGFVKWLLLGELIATGEGIAWPFFIIQKSDENNISHFAKSIDFSNEVNYVIAKTVSLSLISIEQIDQIIDFQKKALHEAQKVNIKKLNKHHPNYGNNFQDYYVKGLKLLLKGFDSNDDEAFFHGQVLLDSWGKWYNNNYENIREGNKIEIKTAPEEHITTNKNLPFTSDEQERFKEIMDKSEKVILEESDLNEIRSILNNYIKRTGNTFNLDGVNVFIGIMKVTNDYYFELGSSFLNSWDQKKVIMSDNFVLLFKTMKLLNLRRQEILKFDIESLKAAARNQTFTQDESGQQFEFSREIILQYIENIEISKSNTKKIEIVMNEFIK